MKTLLIFLCAIVVGINGEHCHAAYNDICSTPVKNPILCNARYGHIEDVEKGMREFIQLQLDNSYKFLFVGAQFGDYQYNRKGLHKLYNKLSDETWDATIDLIKHLTKRGSKMETFKLEVSDFKSNELESIAKTVDIYKDLAVKAQELISGPEKSVIKYESDPEITAYIEDEFLEKYSEKIRTLVGYNQDLKRLLLVNPQTKSLGLEIFDMHIEKFV